MYGNVNLQGIRPKTGNPIRRAKHPVALIVTRNYGHRPANDKLQEENRQLRKSIQDMEISLQLASNNPRSALYPTVAAYLAVMEKISILERQLNAAAEEDQPTIDAKIEALRVEYLKALDAMTAKMQEYINRRLDGRVPRIPLMTVEA